MIRKIAREVGVEYVYGEDGEPIRFDEWEYQNKYIDFKQFDWPMGESSIPFESTLGDGVKIANYRYPVQVGVERKGIVFFIHGYGGCNQHHAYLAEMFARHGYEFCGIDQRGFGNSEGVRGRIESMDSSLEDLMKFNEVYYERFGKVANQDTPCFLIGTSLGGLQAASIAKTNHLNYAGVCPVVPYFALKDPKLLEKIRPIVQAMVKVTPNQKIQMKDYKKAKKHVQEWLNDTSNSLGS